MKVQSNLQEKSVRRRNYRLLFEILGSKLRKRLAIVLVAIILVSGLDFVVVTLIYQFVNLLLSQEGQVGQTFTPFKVLSLLGPTLILPAIGLVIALKSLCQYFLQLKVSIFFAERDSHIAAVFFRATLREKIEARKNRESVESLFLIDRYITLVFENVRGLPYFISDTATALVILAGLIFYSPKSSVILLIVLLIATVIIFRIYSEKQRKLSQSLLVYDRKVNTIKIESQKLATELLLGNRVDETCKELENQQYKSKSTMGKITIIGQMPKYFLEIALIATLSIIYYLNHSGAFIGTLALLTAAAFRVVPLIGSFVSNLMSMKSGLVILDRLGEIVLTLKELDLDFDDASTFEQTNTPYSGDMFLENVGFRYQSAKEDLFENVNSTFKDRTTSLISGASGIGKTTFLHLILGLLEPTHGKIFFSDGLTTLTPGESITGISFLQQSAPLISGTVAENIAGSTLHGFSEVRIKEAIVAAGLELTVSNLKDGFNTHVGEDANQFSAGERQRLGLARALYVNPGLLILDEPTSNLDAETEAGIWKTLAALRGRMTIIIVSHRGVPLDVYDRRMIFSKENNLTVISE
jgi:ABC-type multidrug transport system fused ATPase/permease subunit